MRKFVVVDPGTSPACIVHDTDDQKEARDMAQHYANQHERTILVLEVAKSRPLTPYVITLSTVETTGEGTPGGVPR